MDKKALLKFLLPAALLVAFLAVVKIVDGAQSAQEQAYLATATVYIPPTTTPAPPENKPTMAPSLEVVDQEGYAYTMADFAGKPTVVCFWNMGYPEAKEELATWEEILKTYEDRVNLVVVHVNNQLGGQQEVTRYLDGEDISFTPYFDETGDTARAYDIEKFPSTFFINAEGHLKARAKGPVSPDNLALAMERIGATEE